MPRYLAIVHDICGAPRAWAVARTKKAAQAHAERMWKERVEKRTKDGTLDISEQRGVTTTREVVDDDGRDEDASCSHCGEPLFGRRCRCRA